MFDFLPFIVILGIILIIGLVLIFSPLFAAFGSAVKRLLSPFIRHLSKSDKDKL